MKPLFLRSLVTVGLVLLGFWTIYGFWSLRAIPDPNPTFHVASRYVDLGGSETGFPSTFLATLLDYRSFYLTLLSVMDLGLVLLAVLFSVTGPHPLSFLERVLAVLSLLSSFTLMLWGLMGPLKGVNWLDYEFLTSPSARFIGGCVSGSLALVATLCAGILIASIWTRKREKASGIGKVRGWCAFQVGLLLLILSTISSYHGQWNPFVLTLAAVVFVVSLVGLRFLLLLAIGAAENAKGGRG